MENIDGIQCVTKNNSYVVEECGPGCCGPVEPCDPDDSCNPDDK